MKNTELAELAYKMASGGFGKSTYRRDNDGNNYGAEYNVGTWYNGHWCSDCLGFVHIAVNGFKGDKSKVGGGAVMDNFVWNSDEATTLNAYCPVKGKYPHKDMKEGSLLQSSGHVGLFISDRFDKRFNTAECTTAKGGGWVLTWTDLNTGKRYSEKGGYHISNWENWGEFARVDYKEEPMFSDVKPTDKYYHVYKKMVDEGLMKVDSKKRFKSKKHITRGALALILYRLMKKK